jgi:hypothetical protein
LLERLPIAQFLPVFIIGLHRSGTSLLQQLLFETGCFNTCTLFHLVNRDRLLYLHSRGELCKAREELADLLRTKGILDRGFDAMPVVPETPHEYCYAFARQGRRPKLTQRNLESFLVFCRKLLAVQGPERPILLKNPFDTVNFLNIHRMFPQAKFVFIHRSPAEVINSQFQSILSLFQRKNEFEALVIERYRRLWERPVLLELARLVYSERLPFLINQVCRHVARNCDYMLANSDRLGDAATALTYPHLCNEPAKSVHGVLDFLALRAQAEPDYQRLVRARRLPLAPAVERRLSRIAVRNAGYCRKFGV